MRSVQCIRNDHTECIGCDCQCHKLTERPICKTCGTRFPSISQIIEGVHTSANGWSVVPHQAWFLIVDEKLWPLAEVYDKETAERIIADHALAAQGKLVSQMNETDEREARKQGLIATAGLIRADREAADLVPRLVAALEQTRKMFQYIIGLEQIDLAHRQAEQGVIETGEALEAARKAGVL